jgi:hypothetical protein
MRVSTHCLQNAASKLSEPKDEKSRKTRSLCMHLVMTVLRKFCWQVEHFRIFCEMLELEQGYGRSVETVRGGPVSRCLFAVQ